MNSLSNENELTEIPGKWNSETVFTFEITFCRIVSFKMTEVVWVKLILKCHFEPVPEFIARSSSQGVQNSAEIWKQRSNFSTLPKTQTPPPPCPHFNHLPGPRVLYGGLRVHWRLVYSDWQQWTLLFCLQSTLLDRYCRSTARTVSSRSLGCTRTKTIGLRATLRSQTKSKHQQIVYSHINLNCQKGSISRYPWGSNYGGLSRKLSVNGFDRNGTFVLLYT